MWYNIHMTPKKRYFKKVYDNAPLTDCACGCGQQIKTKDHYARDVKYINGHNNRKYDDPTQYKREWNHRNRDKRYAYKKQWLYAFKAELIDYLGGCCIKCSLEYNGTNAAIFDFHHLKDKEFNVSSSLNKYSKNRIYQEVDKCELLCANCHRLHHSDNR